MSKFIEIPTRYYSKGSDTWHDNGIKYININQIIYFGDNHIVITEMYQDSSTAIQTEKTAKEISQLIEKLTP